MTDQPTQPAVRQARCDDPAVDNHAIAAALRELGDHPRIRRSHHFHGRFENTYVPAELVAGLQPLLDWVTDQARQVLARDELRYGFWFNEMAPGHRTSLHSHEEDDELLSAVYYLAASEASGDLILWDDDEALRFKPEAGLLLMFPPDMPHEVEENRSDSTRLSVAFNFGPAETDDD